ncbi:MAG: hypothetical protein ISP35_04740 [Ilumatobacteraceae bacterium]|nr:hypothetical protein [Ilumatobacteraceae bacterium]
MASRDQRTTTTASRLVRLNARATATCTHFRRWRLRHPLVIDMLTVSSALMLFALLIADRHRLTSELGCTAARQS